MMSTNNKSITLDCDVMQIFWGKDISQYSQNVEDCGKIPLKVDIDLSYTEYLNLTVEGLVDWCRVYWNWATDPQKNQLTKDEWKKWNEQGLKIAKRIRAVLPPKWKLYYLYKIPGEKLKKFYIGKERNIPLCYFSLEQWILRKFKKLNFKYKQNHSSKKSKAHQIKNQNITVHCKKEDGWDFAVYTTIQDDEQKSWAEVYDYKNSTSARFLTVNKEIPSSINDIKFFMFSPKKLETETKEKLLKWFGEKPVRGAASDCNTNWQAIKQAWKDMREFENINAEKKMITIEVDFRDCNADEIKNYLEKFPEDKKYFEKTSDGKFKAETFCYFERLGIVVFENDDICGKKNDCKKSIHIHCIYFFEGNKKADEISKEYYGGRKGVIRSIIHKKLRETYFNLELSVGEKTAVFVTSWGNSLCDEAIEKLCDSTERKSAITETFRDAIPLEKHYVFKDIDERKTHATETRDFDWAFYYGLNKIVPRPDYWENHAKNCIVIPKNESGLCANILDVSNCPSIIGLNQYAEIQSNKNEELDFKNYFLEFFIGEKESADENQYLFLDDSIKFSPEELKEIHDYLMKNKEKLLKLAKERDEKEK